jgi:hypothetical protein
LESLKTLRKNRKQGKRWLFFDILAISCHAEVAEITIDGTIKLDTIGILPSLVKAENNPATQAYLIVLQNIFYNLGMFST